MYPRGVCESTNLCGNKFHWSIFWIMLEVTKIELDKFITFSAFVWFYKITNQRLGKINVLSEKYSFIEFPSSALKESLIPSMSCSYPNGTIKVFEPDVTTRRLNDHFVFYWTHGKADFRLSTRPSMLWYWPIKCKDIYKQVPVLTKQSWLWMQMNRCRVYKLVE